MATVLDKELKRRITVDGAEYTVVIGPEALRVTGKGKRRPDIELRWSDLLNGEAAMAVALNASLIGIKAAPATVQKRAVRKQDPGKPTVLPPAAKKRQR